MFTIIKPVYAATNEITNPALMGRMGSDDGGKILAVLIANLWRTLILLGGLALLLYLVWGSIEWVMAGSDSGKLDSAKQRMTQAVIGMIILSSTVAISIFLGAVLKIDLLNPVFYGPFF